MRRKKTIWVLIAIGVAAFIFRKQLAPVVAPIWAKVKGIFSKKETSETSIVDNLAQ